MAGPLWIKDKLYGVVIPEAMVARMDAAIDPAKEVRELHPRFNQACPLSRRSAAA